MKNIKVLLIATVLIITGLVTTSCEEDSINEPFGNITLKLSDAPLDYDQFKEANIIIEKIQVRRVDGNANGDFITLMDNPTKSNLLELVNGMTETLVDYDLPVGDYDMIRLFISGTEMKMVNGNSYTDEMDFGNFSNNNMMGNGMMANEEMNSIDIEFESMLSIMEGIHEEFLLDVDVNQSFMLEGVNYTSMATGMVMDISGFQFTPMMRFVQMSDAGTISGTVQDGGNFLHNATVTLMQNGKAYTSTRTDENGNFKLIGIPQGGSYSVSIELNGYEMDMDQNEAVMGDFDMMPGSVVNMAFYMNSIE